MTKATMKITVITSTYPRYQGDGVGSFIHSMSANLVRLGHQVIVFAPYDPEVIPGWQSDVGVRRIRYVLPSRWSRLGHARSLSGDVHLQWHAYPLVVLFSIIAIFRLFRQVGQRFGESGDPGWIKEDVNKDGQVNVLDMILIGQHWTG